MEANVSKKHLLTASFAALVVSASPALAKEHHHHSNHDMHAQISELKAQVEALTTQLNQIQAASAERAKSDGPKVYSGNDKLKLKLSGQVNRAMAYYDNGHNSQYKHVDNNASDTRLNFTAEGKLNDNLTMGGVIEVEIPSENSNTVGIGNGSATSNTVSLTERKMEVFAKSKYGNVWVGQGETASHRVSDTDLTGTNAAQEGGELESMAGGVQFWNNTTNAVDTYSGNSTAALGTATALTSTVGSYWQEMGSRRVDRVRYDTPTWYGFTVSASHATRDLTDYGLRYEGEFNKVKLVGAIGYAHNPFNNGSIKAHGTAWGLSNVSRDEYGGSLFALFPIGISIGGGYTGMNFDQANRDNGKLWHLKGGYQKNFFGIGNTCFAISYGQAKAMRAAFNTVAGGVITTTSGQVKTQNSEDMRIWGLYLNQQVEKLAADIYLAYQHHKLDRDLYNAAGTTLVTQDIKPTNAVLLGARVKF